MDGEAIFRQGTWPLDAEEPKKSWYTPPIKSWPSDPAQPKSRLRRNLRVRGTFTHVGSVSMIDYEAAELRALAKLIMFHPIWENEMSKGEYIAGIDPATGINSDITIFRRLAYLGSMTKFQVDWANVEKVDEESKESSQE